MGEKSFKSGKWQTLFQATLTLALLLSPLQNLTWTAKNCFKSAPAGGASAPPHGTSLGTILSKLFMCRLQIVIFSI